MTSNEIQFARFIWELDAAGVPQETLDQMAESMDLEPAELQEIIAEGCRVFEGAKADNNPCDDGDCGDCTKCELLAEDMSWLTDVMFDEKLTEILGSMDIDRIVTLPGVWEIIREELNNEVLEALEEESDIQW